MLRVSKKGCQFTLLAHLVGKMQPYPSLTRLLWDKSSAQGSRYMKALIRFSMHPHQSTVYPPDRKSVGIFGGDGEKLNRNLPIHARLRATGFSPERKNGRIFAEGAVNQVREHPYLCQSIPPVVSYFPLFSPNWGSLGKLCPRRSRNTSLSTTHSHETIPHPRDRNKAALPFRAACGSSYLCHTPTFLQKQGVVFGNSVHV